MSQLPICGRRSSEGSRRRDLADEPPRLIPAALRCTDVELRHALGQQPAFTRRSYRAEPDEPLARGSIPTMRRSVSAFVVGAIPSRSR